MPWCDHPCHVKVLQSYIFLPLCFITVGEAQYASNVSKEYQTPRKWKGSQKGCINWKQKGLKLQGKDLMSSRRKKYVCETDISWTPE